MQHAPLQHDPYAAFRLPDFRRLAGTWFLIGLTMRMQPVVLGWHLYERSGSAMAIAWVGVVQFLPGVLLFLPAGHLADRHDRSTLLSISLAIAALSSTLLALAALMEADALWLYGACFVSSVGMALNRPSRTAILPSLVPTRSLSNAVAWSAGLLQVASFTGPSVAGTLIAWSGGATAGYCAIATSAVLGFALSLRIRPCPPPAEELAAAGRSTGLAYLMGGVRHILSTPVIGVPLTVDMMVVMFGAALGLLPVYAKDILQVGPTGLGWLASAPAIGAISMILVLNHRPESRRPGVRFLWAIAGYGVALLVFALSRWFPLSMAALAAMGALNSISVVTRHTVLQARTPPALRGRVSSANGVFSGASSELGQFEAGALASLTTPTAAVLLGGGFILAMTAYTARRFPELRRLATLTGSAADREEQPTAGRETPAAPTRTTTRQ